MKRLFLPLALLIVLAATSAWADPEQALLCQGRWHVSAGPTTSPGGIGQAGAGEGEIDIHVDSCGDRALFLRFLDGIPDGQVDRVFHRQEGEFTGYRHQTHARMPVVVSLRMTGVRRLVGHIDIADGLVTKPLELTLIESDPSRSYGCDDESADSSTSNKLHSTIAREDGIKALVSAMRRRGLSPPADSGLKLDDYVHTRVAPAVRPDRDGQVTEPGVLRLWLRVDADGNILPREDALYERRLICEVGSRELEPAVQWIMFKPILRTDIDRYETTAQLLEVMTGRIQRSQQARGTDDQAGLGLSMEHSWGALALPAARLTDGRR